MKSKAETIGIFVEGEGNIITKNDTKGFEQGIVIRGTKNQISENTVVLLDKASYEDISKLEEQLEEILLVIREIQDVKQLSKEPSALMTIVEKLGPTGTSLLELYLKIKGIDL